MRNVENRRSTYREVTSNTEYDNSYSNITRFGNNDAAKKSSDIRWRVFSSNVFLSKVFFIESL